MADETKKHLIYVSRLSQAEKGQIYDLADIWSDQDLRTRVQETVKDVCLDRLVRADGCLLLAKKMMTAAMDSTLKQEELRAAIGRAYYSAHHSIRAICLRRNGWDPDGHAQSIEQLRILLGHTDFQRDSGLLPDIVKQISEARNNREVADYSPYDSSRKAGDIGFIPITDHDWEKAARFNITVAETMLAAAVKVAFQ